MYFKFLGLANLFLYYCEHPLRYFFQISQGMLTIVAVFSLKLQVTTPLGKGDIQLGKNELQICILHIYHDLKWWNHHLIFICVISCHKYYKATQKDRCRKNAVRFICSSIILIFHDWYFCSVILHKITFRSSKNWPRLILPKFTLDSWRDKYWFMYMNIYFYAAKRKNWPIWQNISESI